MEFVFEEYRSYLQAIAYRLLGSSAEAEDAVQECWLRYRRAGPSIHEPRKWLGTVVTRICLDQLRARGARREVPLLPDPIVADDDPERAAVEADAVGIALLVVLGTLSPAERVAFVLHDAFGVPFDELAPILDRTPAAVRQLASRGRRRAREAPVPDPDLRRQRRVVGAFLAAARDGDLDGLVAVLDPELELRALTPGGLRTLRGAADVSREAALFAARAVHATPVLVNGSAGLLVPGTALLAFTVSGDRIRSIAIYTVEAQDGRRQDGREGGQGR
ncbi:sigma-70 family RNA polymerase sigma factor [Dactylosporangium sp. McL0621]|uniref:sigma-70 family RNA polymerase sigma factor n=1 Tax=Dactylosporangium sp. McL0621 TaxID=3415678 RepID=UPI003CEACA08